MTKFDEIDVAILNQLQDNGRLSNARLAKAVSLSETPCWRRVKRLQDEGVIEGYQALLNRRQIGLGVFAFVQLGFNQHSPEVTEGMAKVLADCPNVLSCHNTSGEADFILQVVATDLDDYSRFAESVLRVLPGVISITTNISFRELKRSPRLPVFVAESD